uniref:Uncharacterized protein n=1 Tax=Avena sativa TaxID=4498 RepID=A0ACD5XCM7_AVESA
MPRSSSAPGPPPRRRHHRALPPLRLLHRHWPAAPDPPPCDLPVAQPSLCTTGGRGGGRGASSRCCCWTPASAPLPVSFVRLLGSRIWPAQRLCSAGGDRGVGDPRAQAGHGAEPGEEAGGLRACAQPDQKLKVTMAQRARWTSQYEKGLVDVLTEYNFSHYRGQNGWTTEGWNRIVKDLNDQFPEAKFVKSQVQDKEGQLKKEYKVVKSIVNRSGISWNSTSCMINTTPEKWEEIVEEDPKFRRLQGKEFPLFDALDLLYEGNIAQGKHCVTSSQPPHITSRKRESDERQSTRNVALKISAMTSQRFSEDEGKNRFSEVERTSASGRSLSYQSQNDDELNPQGGEEDEDVQRSFDQENSRSGNGGAQSARARKHRSHTSVPVPRIEETMSEFVKLKREQAGIKEQISGK